MKMNTIDNAAQVWRLSIILNPLPQWRSFVAAAALLSGTCSLALAQTPTLSPTPGSSITWHETDIAAAALAATSPIPAVANTTYGWAFTVTQPIEVTDLGVFDATCAGLFEKRTLAYAYGSRADDRSNTQPRMNPLLGGFGHFDTAFERGCDDRLGDRMGTVSLGCGGQR